MPKSPSIEHVVYFKSPRNDPRNQPYKGVQAILVKSTPRETCVHLYDACIKCVGEVARRSEPLS